MLSLFGLTAALVFIFMHVHDLLHPGFLRDGGINAGIFAGSLITAIAPGLILANCMLWFVPVVRRALDQNAVGVPGGSFHLANSGLRKVARFSVPIGLLVLVVAAIDPWH